MYVVCLDAGHGGTDSGAVGPSGLKESDMTLDVCKRARDLLSPYVKVIMTRETEGATISLTRRADYANENHANVFVSYHFNSADSKKANGFEIFSTRGQNNSDKLATAIFKRHSDLFPNQTKRQDWSDGDVDKEAGFSVIRRADCPAVLVEGEFIHTALGETWISLDNTRQLMAQAVAEGVLDFLAVSKSPNTPSTPLTLEQRIARIEDHLGLL